MAANIGTEELCEGVDVVKQEEVESSEGEPSEVIVATRPATAKPKFPCFSQECFLKWRGHFSTRLKDVETGRFVDVVDVPQGPFNYVSQAVGRSLEVADVFGEGKFVQVGEKVPANAPRFNQHTQQKEIPLVEQFSFTIPNVRDFENWPVFPGEVTPEWVEAVSQKWEERHWLGGRLRKLGRWILSDDGPKIFYGRILYPDFEERKKFEEMIRSGRSVEPHDRSWMGGWQFNLHSVIGQAVLRWQSAKHRDDIIPMPLDEIELLKEKLIAGGKTSHEKRQQGHQVNDEVDNVLSDLFGSEVSGGNDDGERGGYRNDKRRYQGGGRSDRNRR